MVYRLRRQLGRGSPSSGGTIHDLNCGPRRHLPISRRWHPQQIPSLKVRSSTRHAAMGRYTERTLMLQYEVVGMRCCFEPRWRPSLRGG